MNIKIFIISSLFLILISSSVFAEKMRIAIMDFKAKGVSRSIANNVSELIRGEMINTGKYIVIERSQMDQIIKEQGLQQTGCSEVSCAVEVGRILSAQKILVGSVMKIGIKIIISGRIVDVEKGIGEFAEKQSARNINNLDQAVNYFTNKLTQRIQGIPVVSPVISTIDIPKKRKPPRETTPPVYKKEQSQFRYDPWYFTVYFAPKGDADIKNIDIKNEATGGSVVISNSFKDILHIGVGTGLMNIQPSEKEYEDTWDISGFYINMTIGLNLMITNWFGMRPYAGFGYFSGDFDYDQAEKIDISGSYYSYGFQLQIRIISPFITPFVEVSKLPDSDIGNCKVMLFGIGLSW